MKKEIGTLLALCFLSFLVGTSVRSDGWKAEAIKNGAAYYHPQTGDFTWKKGGEVKGGAK